MKPPTVAADAKLTAPAPAESASDEPPPSGEAKEIAPPEVVIVLPVDFTATGELKPSVSGAVAEASEAGSWMKPCRLPAAASTASCSEPATEPR